MTRFLIILGACLCACFCYSQTVLAWGQEGHMVVAQIAYNHLDPAVKAKCDALIAVSLTYSNNATTNFVTAACWADDFKSQLGTGTSHYIDLPISLDGYPTNSAPPGVPNIVTALNQYIATLQNTNATPTDRATALRYVLHYVGDIEQPLHCSNGISTNTPPPNGDYGGNDFYITGTWNNLHSLWDYGGGYLNDSGISRPLSAAGRATISNKAAAVEAAYPYNVSIGTIPNPMDWAQEGWNIARTVAYVGITNGTSPTASYLSTAQATSEQHMAIGGQRLGNLLNTIFLTCSYALDPTSASFASIGGTGTVSVTASGSSCAWTASCNVAWITITSATNGTGNGTVSYSVSTNTDTSARGGTLTVAGQAVSVTQAAMPCSYALDSTSALFPSIGGTGTVSVTANGTNCAWTAASNAGWITVTSGSSGTGNGTVSYSVSTNSDSSARGGSLTVAGQTVNVTQALGDSVGDGIPDWWRAQYFGAGGTNTNSVSCATCDATGTGQNNLFKYVAGLDPTNPASVFVLHITTIPGVTNKVHLSFGPAFTGHTYFVQFTLDVGTGDWSQAIALGASSDNETIDYDVLTWGLPVMFYRIAIVNEIVPQ